MIKNLFYYKLKLFKKKKKKKIYLKFQKIFIFNKTYH